MQSPEKPGRRRRPPLFTLSTDSSINTSNRSNRAENESSNHVKFPLSPPRAHHHETELGNARLSEEQERRRASTTNIANMRRKHIKEINVYNTPNPNDLDALCVAKSSTELNQMNTDSKDPNMIIDVLPSFEFYNVLHKHIPQGNVDPDIHDFPPTYQEVQTQRLPAMQGSSSSQSGSELNVESPLRMNGSQTSIHGNFRNSSSNTLLPTTSGIFGGSSLQPYSTRHYSLNPNQNNPLHPTVSGSTAVNDNTNIEDDVNDADNIAIDKLYSLPKFSTPLEIDIRITKHVPKPHEKPEEESVLKEFTSGDIIHGYCVIENRSTQPLKFEMFYVTLEAYISIVDKQKGKRTIKRFLRMVDMSASWSYSSMQVSSGIEYVPGDVDFDDSILGLSNSRTFLPKTKYKKYFMFKIPDQLLDVTCRQEIFPHCSLPPSLGIDKWKDNGKYSIIKVNNVLGCGHLGTKGSPILTNDITDENLSINYTIDAKIVGKEKKTSKLNIMREREYNLRVVPFGFNTPSPVQSNLRSKSQLKELKRLLNERIAALERVFERLKKNEPIQNADIYGTDISGTIDSETDLDVREHLERKLNQLHVRNRIEESDSWSGLKRMSQPDNLVESELRYQIKSRKLNSGTNIANSLFSGFKSSSSMSSLKSSSSSNNSETGKILDGSSSHLKKHLKHSDKTGLITLSTTIPTKAVKYWSPSLFRKTNTFESKNKHDQENWVRLIDLLSEEEKTPLENVNVKLKCFVSNNGPIHQPPGIQIITTSLICITASSDNSIPIQLSSKLLYNEENVTTLKKTFTDYNKKITEYKALFEENEEKLNILYHGNSMLSQTNRGLKFTDFIPTNLHNDVESLMELHVDVTELHQVFRKQSFFTKSTSSNDSYFNFSLSSSETIGNNASSPSEIIDANNSPKPTKSETSASGWRSTGKFTFERDVNVHLSLDPHMKETLPPNFESCLCARFYVVRVCIKFDHHIGTATLDIPVSVKRITT